MSKSLKNFTTIREALHHGEWTARSLRIVFLLGSWKDGIEITNSLVSQGSSWEDALNNFFFKAKDVTRNDSPKDGVEANEEMSEDLEKAKIDTFNSSFNTRAAMMAISDLASKYNTNFKSSAPSQVTLRLASRVTSMVNTFGLNGTARADDDSIGWSGLDIPADATSVITNLSKARDSLREQARSLAGLSRQNVRLVEDPSDQMSQEQLSGARPFLDVLHAFNQDIQNLSDSPSLLKQ